jgi:hypothetical protein
METNLPELAVPAPASVDTDVRWERLDRRFVTMERRAGAAWSAAMSLFWLAIAVAIVMVTPLPPSYRVPLFVAWAIVAAAHAWWSQYKPALTYRHASFRLDGDGIEIRRGVFFRSVINVPRSRVQHTDVAQGPFERKHGLGTLHIYTAGVAHAEVSIFGLEHGRALEIRDALLPRERVDRD